MILPVRIPSALIALLLMCACALAGQRVALLPFADPSSSESGRTLLDNDLRIQLERRGFTAVAPDSVNSILRQLRIRNTASPIEAEVRALADTLGIEFVMTGTIHRLAVDTMFSEAAVCARLLRAQDSYVIWNNCATVSGGGESALLSKPVHRNLEQLSRTVAKKLLATLRPAPKSARFPVTGLLVKMHGKRTVVPSAYVAVIPPVDESETTFAGELFADFLVASLSQRGFNVMAPGRVRNVMLQCEDLRYGQSVETVSRMLADSLGVDLVITGTVSSLTTSRSVSLGSPPETAVELRMIDPRSNIVIWADHLRRSGESGKGLFNTGIVRSPAKLAREMIDDAIDKLRVTRRRIEVNSN